MDKSDLQTRYMELLRGWIDDCRYPSTAMLDRTEKAIRDRDSAIAYVNSLLETVGQDHYPSPPLLSRITLLLDQL
jgi:hypothetical protein